MQITNDERQDRLKKMEFLKEEKIIPFADKYDYTHKAIDVKNLEMGNEVSLAGRIMLFRDMGKLTFAHIQDYSGRVQIVFQQNSLGEKEYKLLIKIINIGDFIGIKGEVFTTHKGEISVLVKNYSFLSKALRPLPDKFHGLKDVELKYRKRYLDLVMNEETKERFKFRSDFIWELRKFYHKKGFQEIDTPVLCSTPSGALAKPFKTHHNALDVDAYLRIAPEIYLKEAIIGGYEKIFEIARVFRNEGTDPSHLQDFSMVEHYCAYWDYKMNMDFTEEMFTNIIEKLKGALNIKIPNKNGEMIDVDFSLPWKRVSFRELILKDCGIDIDLFPNVEDLRNEIKNKKILIENIDKLGRGNLIDSLYKIVSRPKLINPTFLINHPIDLSPLARKNDENLEITDRFQLVVNGWEIVNSYSELIDPIDQAERFNEQIKAREDGDDEAMMKDDEYIEAMEYGMPPISGWGMGIERVVALLTEQSNLRDVVLFPFMRPETNNDADVK